MEMTRKRKCRERQKHSANNWNCHLKSKVAKRWHQNRWIGICDRVCTNSGRKKAFILPAHNDTNMSTVSCTGNGIQNKGKSRYSAGRAQCWGLNSLVEWDNKVKMAGMLGNRGAACSCLNGNGPHKLICLEIWSSGSRAVWKDYKD